MADTPIHKQLVVIDDDGAIVQALTKIAQAEGFSVDSFTDPREAVAALRGGRQWEIMICDYMMAHLNGADVMQVAREKHPAGIRMLLTAANDFKVATDAVNRGEIARIISKPWNHFDLVTALRSASEQTRLRRENAALSAVVQGQNEQLKEINRSLEALVVERTHNLLDGLISALDYRDAETQWHSRRVSRFTSRLAREQGTEGLALQTIEMGALLHDIGKIAVRDSILMKKGPLDPAEWEEMRRHPDAGWMMLRRVPFLAEASLIVLQHQEKWDGTGYPARLKGDEIVQGARLFAVADTFDAITSDRPYRKASPYALARAELERCAGRQFDPAAVEAFCKVPEDDWTRIRAEIQAQADDELAQGLAAPRRPS